MLRPFRRPQSPSHEDAFVDRYPRLLAWARRLTKGDRLAAEDLVHDAFVNFTLSRPNLDAIQNLDGYLFTSLRHLHLANVRRGKRRADTQLPLVEYDSAFDALKALSADRAHEELAAICHYACLRRQSSKAASALILRFFHGYALTEMARVFRLPVRAIDTLLGVARRDVRAWMDNPRSPARSVAAVMSGRPDSTAAPRILALGTPDALVADLQRAIFESAYGACRSASELEQLHVVSAPSLDAETLAHVVSCRACLDSLNALLGLTPLAERHPDDGINAGRQGRRGPGGDGADGDGSDRGGKDSGGAASGSGERKRAEVGGHRVRDISERRPAELRIAVNGLVIGGQHVRDGDMSQHVTVQTAERLGFVEVLDEDDVRLLLLSVDAAPDGAVDQSARIELSDGRELDVTVSFEGAWPLVTVTYRVPEAARARAKSSFEPSLVSSFDRALDPSIEPAFEPAERMPWETSRRSWWRRASGMLVPWPWPRPVLIAVALVVVIALSIGPRQAAAAVVRAGQVLLNVLTSLVSSNSGSAYDGDDRSAARVPRRSADIVLPAPAVESAAVRVASSTAASVLSENARLGLKVAALERLDRVDALLGEGLTLSDGPGGHVTVTGVVQDVRRRREILRALGSLAERPQFDVHLLSPPAAHARSGGPDATPNPTTFYGVDVAADDVPIRELVTRHFESRGETTGDGIERAMRSLSARVSEVSRRAVLHTWAFKSVATQVSEASLAGSSQSNPPSPSNRDAARTWYALLEKHARAFGDLSEELGEALEEAGLASADAPSAPAPFASAALAAEALMRAGADQDRLIRSLFVAVSERHTSTPDPETSLRTLTQQLRVSRLAAHAAALYCTTRIQ